MDSLFVTQGRLGTTVEFREEYTVYPPHYDIIDALYPYASNKVEGVFIADILQVLTDLKLDRLRALFSNKVYHLGMDQPAHAVMTYGDTSEKILIANNFGTAGEAITIIRKNAIIYQERGYANSLGLLATFAADYLDLPLYEFLAIPYEHDATHLAGYSRRLYPSTAPTNLVAVQLRFNKWISSTMAKTDVANFVWSLIKSKLMGMIGDDSDYSTYGEIFQSEHLHYKQVTPSDLIIPHKMKAQKEKLSWET